MPAAPAPTSHPPPPSIPPIAHRCTAEQQIYPTRYYPGLDDDILGLGPQQQQGWSDTLARLIRRLPQEKPPRPADDHTLLLATYQAAGELAAQMQVGRWCTGCWGMSDGQPALCGRAYVCEHSREVLVLQWPAGHRSLLQACA